MKFSKALIVPDVYYPPGPDGQRVRFDVTPARIKRWHAQFAAMRQQGIKIPTCWGHQSTALPIESDQDEQEYQRARFNAGYLDAMRLHAGDTLAGVLDVPGAEKGEDGSIMTRVRLPEQNNVEVKASINEVSVLVGDWIDGKGKKWEDCILHCALVPFPVFHGQNQIQLSTEGPAPKGLRVSLSARFSAPPEEKPVADETKKKPEKEPEKEPEETPEPVAEETETEVEPGEGEDANRLMDSVRSGLEACGIKLPDGFEPDSLESFLAALNVAIAAHQHTKEHYGVDDGRAGEEGTEGQTEDGRPPMEESNYGVMMGTLAKHKDPTVRLFVQQAQRDRELKTKAVEQLTVERRTKLGTRIDRLVVRGLKPATAAKLKDQLTRTKFSLTAEGKPASTEVDRMVRAFEETLPQKKFTEPELESAYEVPHPADVQDGETQANIDYMTRRSRQKAGLKPEKKAKVTVGASDQE